MLAKANSRGTLVTVLTSVLAVAVALAVGALFILLSNQNPIDAYRALLEGAFGSRRAIGETLAASTPYIFGGLAFAVAYRAGLFNIGIEGQMIMGGLAAGLFAAWNLDLPRVIYLPMALLVAAIAGGLWGAIAGALKAISGAHEVITTIMLNYLAFQIVSYTVLRTDKWLPVNPQLQSTNPAAQNARLPNHSERHPAACRTAARPANGGAGLVSPLPHHLWLSACAPSESAKAPPPMPA